MEGTEQLCNDLEIDPSDALMLAFAWRLGADTMCKFTRAQWRTLASYNVKTLADLKKLLPTLMEEAQKSFDRYYEFTFNFGLDKSKGERVLPVAVAVPLWQLVFSNRTKSAHLDNLLKFIERKGTKGITKDTWELYLLFTRTIKDDYSNYDEMEAWPSLLDEFVEDERQRLGISS